MEDFFVQCSSCRRVRINNENNIWVPINEFRDKFPDYKESEFSHGVCLKCAKKLYPEHYEKLKDFITGELKAA